MRNYSNLSFVINYSEIYDSSNYFGAFQLYSETYFFLVLLKFKFGELFIYK